jgi:hypothetical protein
MMFLLPLFTLASSQLAARVVHESVLGLISSRYLYTVAFDDEALTLDLMGDFPTPTVNLWISLSVGTFPDPTTLCSDINDSSA